MSTLQERLIQIRDDLGTNADLARAAGTTRSNVSQWVKNGVKSLKAETALTIEKRTGYLARWIMYGAVPKKKNGIEVSEHSDEKKKDRVDDDQKLLEIIRVFQETDALGRDAIWAGALRASKRIVKYAKPEKRSPSTIRR
jgi:transcriptional regulator with XRE-family HTH domain